MKGIEIKCPKCKWEPRADDLWICDCEHEWHTFDTAGRCPNCSKVWVETQCRECAEWSLHLDWYNGLDDSVKDLLKQIFEKEAAK